MTKDYEYLKNELEMLANLDQHISYMVGLGFSIEGNILNPIITYYDEHVKQLDKSYSTLSNDDISYFIYECDFGRKPKDIIITENDIEITYKIDNIDSLITLLKSQK